MTTMDVSPLPGFDPEIGLLASALIDSTREWRKELSHLVLPDKATSWQERPNGVSIGALFLHLIEAELWWFQEVAGGVAVTQEDADRYLVKQIDQYEDSWPPPPSLSVDDYFNLLEEVRQRSLSIIASLGPANRVVTRSDAPEREYTIRWILAHIVHHDSYHGGQILMVAKRWLRLNG